MGGFTIKRTLENMGKNIEGFPKRAVHVDFHTLPGIRDIGKEFDGKEFASTLCEAGVDFVNVFARCNLGFAYYPTSKGIMYPGLKKDLLGSMVSECRRKGIKVAAYFNAGLDHEHAFRHREWCKVNGAGQVYEFQDKGHRFRKMCLNTGYGDHLAEMAEEVLEKYPVDGLFFDCINLAPCYGAECMEGMKKAGMDVLDAEQVEEYCRAVTDKFRRRMIKPVSSK